MRLMRSTAAATLDDLACSFETPQPSPADSAREGLTSAQGALSVIALSALAGGLLTAPLQVLDLAHALVFALVLLAALLRLAALVAPPPVSSAPLRPVRLLREPSYTVIVPLYGEAAMAGQIVASMSQLNYPAHRLEVLIVLEADDHATLAAFQRLVLPGFMRLLVVPEGRPKTKPRACNHALAAARGDLVVIYDAEDQPDPRQLMEAAVRFTQGPERLVCLQAPLRVLPRPDFIGRMFAAEYALLFELHLPLLARWCGVFPLGGTSNHFRREALLALGGWDPYNVTEDADLGFRLASAGYQCGMLTSPTFEPAPPNLKTWLPQRARWIKGHFQTFGVHSRRPLAGGWARLGVMIATIGVSVGAACLYGLFAAHLLGRFIEGALAWRAPDIAPADLGLTAFSTAVSLFGLHAGLRRSGAGFTLRHALEAPIYWSAQTLAAFHAVEQLVRRPFHWDKTEHQPEVAPVSAPLQVVAPLDGRSGPAYVGEREPAPPPDHRRARRPAHAGMERLRARR